MRVLQVESMLFSPLILQGATRPVRALVPNSEVGWSAGVEHAQAPYPLGVQGERFLKVPTSGS